MVNDFPRRSKRILGHLRQVTDRRLPGLRHEQIVDDNRPSRGVRQTFDLESKVCPSFFLRPRRNVRGDRSIAAGDNVHELSGLWGESHEDMAVFGDNPLEVLDRAPSGSTFLCEPGEVPSTNASLMATICSQASSGSSLLQNWWAAR